jgi:AcrR family transcriptional regulator
VPRPATSKRVDAERNRVKILAAARSAFADPDAEVSMAEVARRAGVGMATLYRNFSGRGELLEALYIDEVNAVCEAANIVEGATPGAVFLAWLHRFFAFIASKHPVGAELLKHPSASRRKATHSDAWKYAASRAMAACPCSPTTHWSKPPKSSDDSDKSGPEPISMICGPNAYALSGSPAGPTR